MRHKKIESSAFLSVENLAVGMTAEECFCVEPSELDEFAEISGDYNPLHMSASFANSKGFAGRVVHGAFLVARISQIIGMRLPGKQALLTGLNLSFVRPIVVGDPVSLSLSVEFISPATRMLEVSIIANVSGQCAARGKAEIVVQE
jgi:acyl dehydratase